MSSTVSLHPYEATWPSDDPHSHFRAEVTEFSAIDPLPTLEGMSRTLDIPIGAVARYILAKWATSGSVGLMELGPRATRQLWEVIESAEAAGTDAARLAAYQKLAGMLSWLKIPLES